LDNFSAGTRGATSAEYFLAAGYAVIFMHRQFSLQPFSRHYSHSTNPFLDFLYIEEDEHANPSSTHSPRISVTPAQRPLLATVLRAHQDAQQKKTLLTLTFVTIDDYLFLLRAVSEQMAVLQRNALYYLAAAVSDFFVPTRKLSEHKIQSGKGSLLIEMDQVPKILKPMVSEWAPTGFIVSFKLETDPNLLIPKARSALDRYGHQVVIGNDLNNRKYEVVFVSRKGGLFLRRSASDATAETSGHHSEHHNGEEYEESWLGLNVEEQKSNVEIEKYIVDRLVRMHEEWCKILPGTGTGTATADAAATSRTAA
jgi:phosphopantothenate-cysteine ligase